MQRERDKASADAWLEFAEDDLTGAEALRKADGPPQVICFLCQQAAEKGYKAYLAWHGEENPPRTHDMALLRSKALALGAENPPEDADELTPYATARYPGRRRVGPDEVEPAFVLAREVIAWVRKTIGGQE
jgi:HEPN domain-containing protein